MIENQELEHSFKAAVREQHHRQSRIGTIIALILLPTGFLLDWAVYPSIQNQLAVYRIGCELSLLLIFLLHLIPGSIRYTKILSFSWALVIEISICLMIIASKEPSGPYYAGLNLVVLGFILMLPLTLFEAILLAVITVSAYSATTLLAGAWLWNKADAVNNFYFLVSTCFIGCCASYYSAQRRFREYKLNYELDLRTKELAELDKAKSNFYAHVSHEFRTPLTLILAPIEDLLRREDFDNKTIAHLVHIKDNGYRLLKLVNDLLDVLKLEEKSDFFEKQPVRLNSLLASICSDMESLAKRQTLQFEFIESRKQILIDGDESALDKIFLNLINNAIKFTEVGGSVTVKLSSDDKFAIIDVIDTGAGISREQLPYIFDKFHQADSSSTKKHKGTGLGLALVKELTHLHEGDITVKSKLGKGTEMRVTLPLGSDSADSVVHENEKPQDKTEATGLQELHISADHMIIGAAVDSSQEVLEFTGASKEAPTLVIVEDDPGIREYLAEVLSDDYQIYTAIDGEEGLKKIQNQKPDLVITDLMLPKMDGLSICSAIKKDSSLRSSKVILLTARTDENSKLDALRRGADDFLTKPFSTVEIKSRLRNLWNTSELQRNIEKQNVELSKAIEELTNTQGKLIQSEKLNALGRLAAGLLHEVNNPLSFSFATLQLLEREQSITEDQYAQELISDIKEGMERILVIVKDLKAFAYPETTDLDATFSLKKAIESAMRFTASKTSGIDVQNNAGNEMLIGSQSHIVQVMVNLLENAADAMQSISDRPKKILIEAKRLDNGRIQVIFEDNGPGIPEDIKGKIFDPFYTTKDVGAGLGMGLSICHTIIENHKGILAVESEKDSHTTFTFDLDDANNLQHKENEFTEELHGEQP